MEIDRHMMKLGLTIHMVVASPHLWMNADTNRSRVTTTPPTNISRFTNVDVLAGTCGNTTISHRQRDAGSAQGRLDVPWHVVGSLVRVLEKFCAGREARPATRAK